MKSFGTLARVAAAATLACAVQAQAATWNWQYGGDGIDASGTFTTTDTPDASGAYLITAITGSRNGVAITGLQAPGSAIPGNSDYPVDDLLTLDGAQLSEAGFGYALADGSHANPFWYDGAYEYLSVAPYPEGDGAEVGITFSATLSSVPEPATAWLALAGLGALMAARRRANGR